MKQISTVKCFNSTKRYGFISPDKESKNVFIHVSALNAAALDNLNEDQKIKFEITSS